MKFSILILWLFSGLALETLVTGTPVERSELIDNTTTKAVIQQRVPPPLLPPVPKRSSGSLVPCDPSLKPDKNGYAPPGTCNAYTRNYPPSFASAVIASLLFTILFLVHIIQAISVHKSYNWIIVEAAVLLVASYTLRAAGTRDQQNPYIVSISDVLLLVSPIVVNAFVYAVFVRMFNFYSPKREVWGMGPPTVEGVITCASFVPFMLQLAGGVLVGPLNHPEIQMKAITIYMFGIGLQQLIILGVLVFIIKFHLTSEPRKGIRTLLYALYLSLAAISIRVLFRLIEFSGGFGVDNKLVHSEMYFYGFEAVPMLFVLGLWCVCHPGKYLRGPGSELESDWFVDWVSCCTNREGRGSRGTHRRLNSVDSDE